MSNLSKSIILAVIISILLINTEAATNKTSSDVKSRMLKGDNVQVIIILKDQPVINDIPAGNLIPSMKKHAADSQSDIVFLLNEEKKKDKNLKIKQFWILNAISVNAPPALIDRLSERDDVELIELDNKVHMLEDQSALVSQGQINNATNAIKWINATKAWENGIDGTGINVSIIDTGVYLHPEISGRLIKWKDYINFLNIPYDDHGHGTHVAGTVGGNGAGGVTTGVAPNVNLFGVKVLDRNGSGDSTDVIYGIQLSVDNKADIISMSLGGGRDISMKYAINNAINAGVTVIAAAGNSGPGARTIEYPGGEKNVIAVGAVNSLDAIASFSSRGPITVDGEELVKPDISAPGVCINSLSINGGYANCWSGTSMATPHVSGAAALLLQASRRSGVILSPAQVKGIIGNTSVDLGLPGKDTAYGEGRIDVFKAISNYSILMINGTVKDKITKAGIPNAIVSTNTSRYTVTNAAGFYSLKVNSGTFHLTGKLDPTYNNNNSIIVSTLGGSVLSQDIELVGKQTGSITGRATRG